MFGSFMLTLTNKITKNLDAVGGIAKVKTISIKHVIRFLDFTMQYSTLNLSGGQPQHNHCLCCIGASKWYEITHICCQTNAYMYTEH